MQVNRGGRATGLKCTEHETTTVSGMGDTTEDNRDRRAVLKGIGAALAGSAVGLAGMVEGAVESAEATGSGVAVQEVDTSLPPGAVLFDLGGDGAYDATVERAPESMGGDARPNPIRITSGGTATVDYAASVVEPEGHPALGDLDQLSYDYYAGPDDGSGGGGGGGGGEGGGSGDSGGDGGVPDETFLVVENDEGRHGLYLTYHDGRAAEQWRTHDVLARVTGDTAGTSGWFEYTGDGATFDDAVARYGADARLVRVGVGRGDGVTPTTLDAAYGALVVNDREYRFPVSVARRSASPPF